MRHRLMLTIVMIVGLACTASCKRIAKGLIRKGVKSAVVAAEETAVKAGRAAHVHIPEAPRAAPLMPPLGVGETGAERTSQAVLRSEAEAAERTADSIPHPEVEVAAERTANAEAPGYFKGADGETPPFHGSHDGIEPASLGAANASTGPEHAVAAEVDRLHKEEARELIAHGDEVAGRGDLARAADRYERAAALDPAIAFGSRDGRARSAITALVRRRGEDAARALNDLLAAYGELPPELEEALFHAMRGHASPEATDFIFRVLEGGASTVNGQSRIAIAWHRGRLTTMRDVKAGVPVEGMNWRSSVSDYTVYVDDRMAVGQEGLLHDLLHDPDAWRRHPDVQIEYLGSIGELPSVLHQTTSGIFAQPMVKRAAIAGHVVLVSLRDNQSTQRANPR
jgi:hypothetical protein